MEIEPAVWLKRLILFCKRRAAGVSVPVKDAEEPVFLGTRFCLVRLRTELTVCCDQLGHSKVLSDKQDDGAARNIRCCRNTLPRLSQNHVTALKGQQKNNAPIPSWTDGNIIHFSARNALGVWHRTAQRRILDPAEAQIVSAKLATTLAPK